ncbi:MAG: hypothetical protein CfClM3_0399 [Methanobrevibacter sp. CfCl-M3]
MNYKAIFLISMLIMGGISSVSSADVFSGFVDDGGIYLGAATWIPQWKVSQYDSHGDTLIDCKWETRHKEKNLINQTDTIIHYEYRDLINILFVISCKATYLKLNIYNYHGGEVKIIPHCGALHPGDRGNYIYFDIYLDGKLVDTHRKDKSGKAVTILPNDTEVEIKPVPGDPDIKIER